MPDRLLTAARAARAAGQVLRDKFNQAREIHSKGKRDIVTDADFAAESAVHDILTARFPDDGFVSEEGTAVARAEAWARGDADPNLFLWVVDPLDGTTNYAHRQPIYAVSIAAYQNRTVQLGVIYDPMRNELFAARRGRGATVNGKRMAVSGTRRLDQAVLGLEWSRSPQLRARTAQLVTRMSVHVTTVRCNGSAALSLCWIAAGRLDAYFHLSLAPWDVAAGALIVEEAGGKVTTPAGVPWSVHSQSYVATNGHLHRAMLGYFRQRDE